MHRLGLTASNMLNVFQLDARFHGNKISVHDFEQIVDISRHCHSLLTTYMITCSISILLCNDQTIYKTVVFLLNFGYKMYVRNASFLAPDTGLSLKLLLLQFLKVSVLCV